MNHKEIVEALKDIEEQLEEIHDAVATGDIGGKQLKDIDYYTGRVSAEIERVIDEVKAWSNT